MILPSTHLFHRAHIHIDHDIPSQHSIRSIDFYELNYSTYRFGFGRKRAPKEPPRSTPLQKNLSPIPLVNQIPTSAMIDQGVTTALAARDANRNGDDSHTSGTGALTWWNSYVRIVGHDVAYAMTWIELRKKMTDKYCPRNEIKKLEAELWNLKVKAQQQLPKRQNVVQAYAAGTGERKEYAGTLPLCNKCKFHHNGPCTVKCANCKRVGHLTRDCWSSAATNNQRTLTCYECGNQGHYKSDCPKLKNRNHGNQAEGTGTHGMVLALGGGETDQDPNNIEDEIEA
ncbi:reverse transcriptase domain-containing protein [Tanacetum coccineum]